MSTVITAGNATNGLSLSADNAGSFQFKTGTGAGTTAVTIDSSQNVTIAGTAAITGGISGNLSINGSTSVISASSVFGYGTGAGGTVTQATSKSTSVTLNKPTGKITMNGAALAAGASVGFTFNNSLLTTNDTMLINIQTAVDASKYVIAVEPYAGAAAIIIRNVSAGSLSEALILTYTVIRGATS
jgi:hypothetical protein